MNNIILKGYTEEVIHEIQQLDVPNQYKLSDNRKKLIIKILGFVKNWNSVIFIFVWSLLSSINRFGIWPIN